MPPPLRETVRGQAKSASVRLAYCSSLPINEYLSDPFCYCSRFTYRDLTRNRRISHIKHMLDQADQYFLGRLLGARVAQDNRQAWVEVERHADVFHRVAARAVEDVERDDERDIPALEVIDCGEAVGEPPGVGKHHRPERAEREFVPHEPEPLLPGRAEQVEHQVLAQRDAAEVHRHRGDGLALDAGLAVDVLSSPGPRFLGGAAA